MNTIETTLTTQAIFNDDHTKRYLLCKVWDDSLPKVTVIMLAPSEASGVALDTTTQLCLNNASRLGYGSIAIVNLFATINDFGLKQQTGFGDPDNLNAIIEACQNCDQILYCPGTGKARNKFFISRQEEVLTALLPMEEKLSCCATKSAIPGSTTPSALPSVPGFSALSRLASWSISSPRNPSNPKRPPKRSRKADPRLRKRNLSPSNQEKTPCPTWAGCV